MAIPARKDSGWRRMGSVHNVGSSSPRRRGGISTIRFPGWKGVPTQWTTWYCYTRLVTGNFMLRKRHHDRLPQGGFEGLEPYDGKLSCTVLRGACGLVTVLRAGNGPRLPDRPTMSTEVLMPLPDAK